MPIPESFLQELKFKSEIEDVISPYVQLKRRGSTLVGLCPFHNEKTPSFTVYPQTQSFYCFGCGAGGDAITFIKKIENLDYVDAVRFLAERAGLNMPEEGVDDSLSVKRRTILEINRAAAKFFYSSLYAAGKDAETARQYYQNRKLTEQTIRHFGLGYAPNTWDALLRHLTAKGYKASDVEQAGLARRGRNGGYYDVFRNRVTTPIIDVRGNVIAFGGRVLDDSKPKYINTSDTLVYKKTNALFSLNFAKESGERSIILCEGYMDVIMMHQAGFPNAVAGCGTALTEEQVHLIARYADEVILVYDADEAGQKALNKAVPMFRKTDLKIRIPSLYGGKDPDEIIKNLGADRFRGMIEKSANETEYALLKLRDQFPLETTSGKIQYVNACMRVLADVSPVEQDVYLSRLADELQIEKTSLTAQLQAYQKRHTGGEKYRQNREIVRDSITDNVKEAHRLNESVKAYKAQDRLIVLLMLYPDCAQLLDKSGFSVEAVNNGFFKTVFTLLAERIQNALDISLTSLSQYLSEEELSRLSRLAATGAKSDDPKREFLECLKTLQAEYRKAPQDITHISDDDFRHLFDKNNKNHT